MATKLHQLLALTQGTKQRAQTSFTKFYHQVQKPDPFNGIVKTYQPRDEEGEKLPGESQRVQLSAYALIAELQETLKPMYKLVGDIDRSNLDATADVIIDGQVVLADAPVATLLWLEKQLADMRTVLDKIPTLSPEFVWSWDGDEGVWTTAERVTTRAKKIPRNHVKAEATEKHPAQVEVYYEDVNVGTWHTRGLSGAMRPAEVKAMKANLEKVRDAVKDARERANAVEVQPFDASVILEHVFHF